MKKRIFVDKRIPKDYFITKGKGESDLTTHAGSYHFALHDAGIMECNIITYSSVLPAEATEIKKPEKLTFGSVMETIMAVADSEKGQRATAGIIFGWFYNKKTGEKEGGIVCEYHGNMEEEIAEEHLKETLNELYEKTFAEKFELKEKRIIMQSFVPEKKFGTALVALCFINYLHPVIE